MKKQVYTVHAFKFGSRDAHSYIVGVYSKKQAAIKAAEAEEDYRGGNKYACEVREWFVDVGNAGKCGEVSKQIKPLEPIVY